LPLLPLGEDLQLEKPLHGRVDVIDARAGHRLAQQRWGEQQGIGHAEAVALEVIGKVIIRGEPPGGMRTV
jgi:hypothetical protein